MTPINQLARDIGNPAADMASLTAGLMRLTIFAASTEHSGEGIAVDMRRSLDAIAMEHGRITMALAAYDVARRPEEAKP